MGEHVPNRSRAFPLVGGEEVVELQDAREQGQERITRRRVGQRGNRFLQPAQGEKLPVIEEVTPRPIVVTKGLPCVEPVGQGIVRQTNGAAPNLPAQHLRTLNVRRQVTGCRRDVLLLSGGSKKQLAIEAVKRRSLHGANRLDDLKRLGTGRTRCLGPVDEADVGIEFRSAWVATNARVAVMRREDGPARRTADLNPGFSVRIGIPCHNARGE